jgi:hypothetical protein
MFGDVQHNHNDGWEINSSSASSVRSGNFPRADVFFTIFKGLAARSRWGIESTNQYPVCGPGKV